MKNHITSKVILASATLLLAGLAASPALARPDHGPVLSPGDTGALFTQGYALRSKGGQYIVPSTKGNDAAYVAPRRGSGLRR